MLFAGIIVAILDFTHFFEAATGINKMELSFKRFLPLDLI
jgi:hypothetical protein